MSEPIPWNFSLGGAFFFSPGGEWEAGEDGVGAEIGSGEEDDEDDEEGEEEEEVEDPVPELKASDGIGLEFPLLFCAMLNIS